MVGSGKMNSEMYERERLDNSPYHSWIAALVLSAGIIAAAIIVINFSL
jgi:hypothetical protein